ncbi:HipA domain-containing protein [Daejeonella sp.]|uniref:HipA domain-containing protein n=1 Tax=Daejeonella sp. TaxID=2805397 RepID=UPI003784F2EC
MNKKCLYCYGEMADLEQFDYHPKCSLAFFGSNTPPSLKYSLSEMNELAKEVVTHRIAVPGVQAKLSLSLIDEVLNRKNVTRLTVVGALGGNYIFKPPSNTYPEMPENEHLTMKIAEAFGIQTVPSSLIRLQSGELAYITKRIDRTLNGQKIHMLDMFQITEAVDKYKSTMERVAKALRTFSADTLLDQLKYFELTVFCFLTGNNDMHLKNFSMIEKDGKWSLSPAYDLLNVNLANSKDKEELALSMEGKKRKFTRLHFERFGAHLGLNNKQIQGVFNRFEKNKSIAKSLIDLSFLSEDSREKYWKIMENQFKSLQ